MNFLKIKLKNTIQNFKNPLTPLEQPLKFERGLLMWFCLFLAYTIFTMTFIFGTLLAGTNSSDTGYLSHYFPPNSGVSSPPRIVTESINWGITFGRAIGSVIIGWVIVKFTHKYACLISISLLLFAIPSGYSPTYAGFVIMRTMFAIGGTTLIILLQPIVATYCNQKQKGILSVINPTAANTGMIIPMLLFAINPDVSKHFRNQWQLIFLFTSLLLLIPLILYMLFGQRFDQYASFKIKQLNQMKQFSAKESKISLFSFFKQKETYIWTIVFGSWLILAILPIILLRFNLHNAPGFYNIKILDASSHYLIYYRFLILFVGGLFIGQLIIGIWPQLKARRKMYIFTILGIGFLFMVGGILSYIFLVAPSEGQNIGLFYFCGFMAGTFIWGIEGVLLYLPHEYPNANPKKMGFQFGLIWGLGYLMLTFFHILIVLVDLDLSNPTITTPNSKTALIGLIIYIILSAMSPLSILLIKEPKPNFPLLPKRNDLWIKEKK